MKQDNPIFPPHLEGHLSTGTEQTFATTTTRTSSVVPAAEASLGLSEEQAKNLTAEEALDHYNDTEVGNVNRERLNNTMLPQPIAKRLNEEVDEEQTRQFRSRTGQENQNSNTRKYNKVPRLLIMVIAVFVVIAIVASSVVASGSLAGSDGNNVEEANDAPDADITRNLALSDRKFSLQQLTAFCSTFPSEFRGFGSCINDQLAVCGGDSGKLELTECSFCAADSCVPNALSSSCDQTSCFLVTDMIVSVEVFDEFNTLSTFLTDCDEASGETLPDSICIKDENIFECVVSGNSDTVVRNGGCSKGCNCAGTTSRICSDSPVCNDDLTPINLTDTLVPENAFTALCSVFPATFAERSICTTESDLTTCLANGNTIVESCPGCSNCPNSTLSTLETGSCAAVESIEDCDTLDELRIEEEAIGEDISLLLSIFEADCFEEASVSGLCNSEGIFIGCVDGSVTVLSDCNCQCNPEDNQFCVVQNNGRGISAVCDQPN